MHLIQILLPLYDNAGNAFDDGVYVKVRTELAERFGGLTAFTRAPAQGLWRSDGKTTHDDIVVFEVMAAEIDPGWWKDYRTALEAAFRQDTIVIRAQDVTIL
jgi:flavin-binding protein dodecin